MGTVAVVGSINADLGIRVERFPRPGETLHATGGLFSPGGKGANQALAAALQGAEVVMVGAVGDDAAAGEALALLRDGGVGLGHLHVEPGPTGLAVVAVDEAGENQILVVAGANAAMGAERVGQQAAVVQAADVVVVQGEIPRDGIEQAARLCTGRLVVNLAPVVAVDPAVLRQADPLVANEHEVALVLAQLAQTGRAGGVDGAGEDELVRALLAAGCRSVVLTLGSRGALVGEADGITRVPATEVRAVDTTGAGDAFVGALAAGLAGGAGLVAAARAASAMAGDAVQRAGAQSSYRSAGTTP